MVKIPRENNLDFIRLFLAIIVFFAHVNRLTGSDTIAAYTKWFSLGDLAVQCFFVISGFLIFMSFETTNGIKSYFQKRFRRIYPAYFTVIVFSFMIGIFFTDLIFTQYGVESVKYLAANLIFMNFLQPELPQVFSSNLHPEVNGSLWTIKIEVMFYISVPILAIIFRKLQKFRLHLIIGFYILSYIYLIATTEIANNRHGFWEQLPQQLPGQLTYFLGGALLYYYFDLFKKRSHLLFVISAFVFVVCSIFNSEILNILLPISLAVIVIYAAFAFPVFKKFGKYGDYSYGVYIFHYPILQFLISAGLYEYLNDFLALIISAVLVALAALLSWNFIEKPALQPSRKIKKASYKTLPKNI